MFNKFAGKLSARQKRIGFDIGKHDSNITTT